MTRNRTLDDIFSPAISYPIPSQQQASLLTLLEVCMQCTLKFFWREINRRDLVLAHHLEEILEVQMEKFSGFPLRNTMPAQQCHNEHVPYPCRNLVLRPTKACDHLFGQHKCKALFFHAFSMR